MSDELKPAIYVVCLATSKKGVLHGCWIDVTQNVEDILQAIKTMLADSPCSNAQA
jgi:hypothetical protein